MAENNDLTKLNETHLTLSERLRLRRSAKVLCIDVSGSMSSDVEPGKSKIDALRDVVQSVEGNPKMYCFASGYDECYKDSIPDPAGDTRLADLLIHLKDKGIRNCLVITDGDITDKVQTLDQAQDMNIQVMYIGAGPRPAFLDELSNGGFATTEDLKETKQLTNKIQLLIGSGGEYKKGAIEL